MVDLFKVSDPSEALGNSITAREILDKGAARIDKELLDQPAIQATLMDTMGTVYTSLGSTSPPSRSCASPTRSASHCGARSMRGRQQPQSPRRGPAAQGGLCRAEQRLREALVTRRKVFGDRSPQVADTLSSLAETLTAKGEFTQVRAPGPKRWTFAGRCTQGASRRRAEHRGSRQELLRPRHVRGGDVVSERGRRDAARLHVAVHPALAQALGTWRGRSRGSAGSTTPSPTCGKRWT